MRTISRVAVLGSGVMGGAIAAHLANCGIPSLMLDIVPPDLKGTDAKNLEKRNAFTAKSKANLLKAKPSPTYRTSYLDRIEIGNFDDDMARIAECDWIIEVVSERLDIKLKVLESVKKHRKPGTIVSTNTSGIPLKSMAPAMDEEMTRHFLGTHFFNPPRYLKLVEIIPGAKTDPAIVSFMAAFLENELGKGVVYAKDTPNFIANRILTFGSQYILSEMQKDGLRVEEVDALTGPVVGHASSATFRTADLVGLDTLINVVGNVRDNCPNDEQIALMQISPVLEKMAAKKMLGDKTGGGFYKATDKRDEKGSRIILGLDFKTLEYRDPIRADFPSFKAARKAETLEEKLKIMYSGEDKGAEFSRKLFANTALYAANRIPEIADDIVNIDNAVKWGFAWEIGIFEQWDLLGFEGVTAGMEKHSAKLPPIVQAMKEKGAKSFYKDEGGKRMFFDLASKSYKPVPQNPNNLSLPALKKNNKIVKENESASLVDLGDGIVCCEFHTKMNSIDAGLGEMIRDMVDMLNEGKFEGGVIGNQAEHFCAGANVFLILGEAMQKNWDNIDRAVNDLQQVLMGVRFCRRPIVTAPHHYTLGGGCEISQAGARAVIAGETYGGLVEVGVGLVPGGGGCKELLRRAHKYVPEGISDVELFPFVQRAFENIALAKVSTSGAEMIQNGHLDENDIVCPSFDQQIKRAKDVCVGLIKMGYKPPLPAMLTALGEPARAKFRIALYGFQLGGFASEHDALIAEKVANILTGGNRRAGTKMTEQDVLDLEREAFVSLVGTEKSQARIQAMLMTGKPLRN